MKKFQFLLFIFLINSSILYSQESFQIEFDTSAIISFATLVSETEKISLLLSGFPFNDTLYYVEDFDPNIPFQNIKVIWSPYHNFVPWFHKVYLHNESELIFKTWSIGYPNYITYINFETEEYWDYSTNELMGIDGQHTLSSVDENGNIYLFGQGDFLRILKISNTGQITNPRRYGHEFSFHITDVLYIPSIASNTLIGYIGPGSYVAVLDTLGSFIEVKTYEDVYLNQIIADPDGGYYVMGSTSMINNISQNEEDLVLMKLDAQLNVIWSAAYHADNFNYKRSTLSILPDGNLAIVYSTRGAYPVILTRLDNSGNIIWEKGYPLYEPEIDIMSDGSLLLTSYDIEHYTFKVIFSKTDTLGDIDGCEVFPTCLYKKVISVSSADLSFISWGLTVPEITSEELFFSDTIIGTTNSCNIPPTPDPFFELPDTVCMGTTIELTDLPNQYAHAIAWQLSGNGIDSTWQDSTSFAFNFDQQGTFYVEQTIWFLGCNYTHTEEVNVIDEPNISIEIIAGDLCGNTAVTLEVSADQMMKEVAWSNGSNIATTQIEESAWVDVSVSNGYCQVTDSIFLQFVIDASQMDSILILPEDTTVCSEDLPYTLIPESPYTESFILEGFASSQFVLQESGEYEIQIEKEDCIYIDTFNLEVDPCSLQIYIPNIFSPNGDNNNDYFQPLGNGFEILSLDIFDRWGGHLYKGQGIDAQWDGKNKMERNVQQGVYVYKIIIQDTWTQTIETYTGDVLVIR